MPLTRAKWCVVGHRALGAALVDQSPVIRGEEDDGPIRDLQFLQLSGQAADGVVDGFNHGRINRVLLSVTGLDPQSVLLDRGFSRLPRDVNGKFGQVEEERPIPVGLEESLGLAGQLFGDVVIRRTALDARQIKRAEVRPGRTALRPSDVLGEALGLRPELGSPQMPLPDARAHVSLGFQPFSDGDFPMRQLLFEIRGVQLGGGPRLSARDPVGQMQPGRAFPCQDAGSSGGTDRT